MTPGRVHVVGSVNVDLTLPVERLPEPGATILAGDSVRTGGGKGANAAVAAARAGAAVRLVAAVGDDDAGRASLAELEGDDVDCSAVAVLGDRPTGLAMICVDATAENFIVVASGANAALDAGTVAAALSELGPEDVCVVNFEIPEDAVAAASRAVAASGARLLVNPSPVRRLEAVDVASRPTLVANAGEIRALCGAADPEAAARALQAAGWGDVVVTHGARGVEVLDARGRRTAVAPHAVRAVDTVGAGDTFTGVLADGLWRGAELLTAVRRAAVAAALATTGIGARVAMPRAEQIEAALR